MLEVVTMIALDSHAVEGEISERAHYDLEFKAETQGITRDHINEALQLVNPSDAFFEMFDELRMTVIEMAAELARAAGGT